ncbi:hypothetical protein TRSC58_07242 [Trypanosoma rangeli SC58]|uniref:Uncharacterized protein n=1 Tax=Trypanosoma rangeli SC58 TaxID=429131 RepID=A0A061ITN2_TRYRA|nr:hypothetical protein TRSC58_07242 [Trypanosoma rangeli SC58]
MGQVRLPRAGGGRSKKGAGLRWVPAIAFFFCLCLPVGVLRAVAAVYFLKRLCTGAGGGGGGEALPSVCLPRVRPCTLTSPYSCR